MFGVAILAEVLGVASSLGFTGTALTLAAAEELVTLIEDGLLGFAGPSFFRQTLGLARAANLRKVEARTRIEEARAAEAEAHALEKIQEARERVSKAVQLENARTLSEISNADSFSLDALNVVEELRAALINLKRSGGHLSVDAVAIRKAKAKRRPAKKPIIPIETSFPPD